MDSEFRRNCKNQSLEDSYIDLLIIVQSNKTHFCARFRISIKLFTMYVSGITFNYLFCCMIKKWCYVFRLILHSLIIPMDCMKFHFLSTFVCVAMYVITFASADQHNSSSFLSNYARHQNICYKIGWEPKCRKGKNYVVLKFLKF